MHSNVLFSPSTLHSEKEGRTCTNERDESISGKTVVVLSEPSELHLPASV